MKKFLLYFGLILLALALYILYTINSVGFFRTVENTYEGSLTNVMIPGAEDFAISRTGEFLIVSSDDRAGRRDGLMKESGLYWMDLSDKGKTMRRLKAQNDVTLFPHGISMIQLDSNIYRLLVVNHVSTSDEALGSLDLDTKHSIEEYRLEGQKLTHVKTFSDPMIKSPNDVVAIDATKFYFTNDHGSDTKLGLLLEDYLGFARSFAVYYNGKEYTQVTEDMAYANGINFDGDRNIMYVASPRSFSVKAYRVQENGLLDKMADIDCGTGVDNIEFDENGQLWIGCHPKLLTFTSYATGKISISPSEIITIDLADDGSYVVNSIYQDDGSLMSAATTAIPFKDKVYVGNVMDEHFLVIDRNELNQ